MKVALCSLMLYIFLIPVPILAQNGSLISDQVHAVSLEGNLLGDSPDRSVNVYLPPGYEKQTKVRYPVLYLLHGATTSNKSWLAYGGKWNIREAMDKLIAEGKVRPLIIVMPDGSNKYVGSYYTNSVLTGNGEDFITAELVKYIDAKYRTLPNVASRGIAGHSMGGYGAIKLGMKHPEIYGVVYGLSACCLSWSAAVGNGVNDKTWHEVLAFKTVDDYYKASTLARLTFGKAAVMSPNPAKAPLFVDFPFSFSNESGSRQIVEEVHARWSANMPVAMADQYRTNLLRLRAIAFEVSSEGGLVSSNRELSDVLKRNQIPHTFEEYEGNHINKTPERVETKMLPFFSLMLEFSDKIPSTKRK